MQMGNLNQQFTEWFQNARNNNLGDLVFEVYYKEVIEKNDNKSMMIWNHLNQLYLEINNLKHILSENVKSKPTKVETLNQPRETLSG